MEVGNAPVDASYDELFQIIEYLKSTDKHNSAYLDELIEHIKNSSKKENVYTKSTYISKIKTIKAQPDKPFAEKENIQAKSLDGKNGTTDKTSKGLQKIIENKTNNKRKSQGKSLLNNKRKLKLKPKQNSFELASKVANEKAKINNTNDVKTSIQVKTGLVKRELQTKLEKSNLDKIDKPIETILPFAENAEKDNLNAKEKFGEGNEHPIKVTPYPLENSEVKAQDLNLKDKRKGHSKKSPKLTSPKSENRETAIKDSGINRKVLQTKLKATQITKRNSGDLPLKCNECSYTTTLKRRFEAHIRTHKYKPFRCIYCDIDFPLEDTYNHHMESHYRKMGHNDDSRLPPKEEEEEEEEDEENKDIFSNLADFITDDADLDESDHSSSNKKIKDQHSISEKMNIDSNNKNDKDIKIKTKEFVKDVNVETENSLNMNEDMDIETKDAENENPENSSCETLLKCKDCSYTTTLKRRFEAHIQTHEYKQYKCIQCDEDFILEESYNQHMERHNKKFSCDLCERTFSKEINLVNHKINKHPEAFASTPAPTPPQTPCKTVYTPTSIKIIKCPHCKFWTNAFQLESHLAQHGHISQNNQMGSIHEKDLSLSNQIVLDSMDNDKKDLLNSHNQHITNDLENKDNSKNPINDTNQLFISSLDQQNSSEFQDLEHSQYTCKICNKIFTKSFLLKRHLFFHQGPKLKACKLCKYKCFSSSLFVLHTRTHSQEKPFKCPRRKCNHSFILFSQLKRHLRNHSSNLYKCAHCTFFSAHSRLISLHQEKMHR